MSVSLLPNQLSNAKLRVSVAWGADPAADPGTWTFTDITTDVLQDNGNGINITVGRQNEFSTAAPAQCTVRLKNQTGAYTPFGALGSNYPNVLLGTPVRVEVSLDGGSTWDTRFQGEAASWLPKWDAQGRFAYVVLTASGITRRLGSGLKPLKSALYRWYLANGVGALWPLDDGNLSTSAYNAIEPRAPLQTSGTVSFAGGSSTLPGTTQTVTVSQDATISGAPNTLSSTGHLLFDFWVRSVTVISDTTSATTFVASLTLPTLGTVDFYISNGTHPAAGASFDPPYDGNSLDTWFGGGPGGIVTAPFDGGWHNIALRLVQSGSDVAATLFIDGVQGDSTTLTSLTLGLPTDVTLKDSAGDIPGPVTGSVDFAMAALNTTSGAGNSWDIGHLAHSGETAADRLTRLCAEEGVALTLTGLSDTAMGPQGADTLMNLLRQCEATDLGVLLDGLGPGLTYVTRDHVLNNDATLTVDANSGQVPATGPQPAHDDQLIRNRVTVTNANGSTVTAEKEAGTLGTATIGVWDDLRTVNTDGNSGLSNIAAWLVHVGTVEGLRYPTVPLDFAAAPENATDWISLVPAGRFDLTNISDQLTQHPVGDVALSAEGWSEFLSSRQWRASVNSSSYRANQVAIVADSTFGRVDTAGSTVHQNYSAGATSVKVDVNTGPLWSTSAPPFDLEIRGLQVHVTAISGSSSPQTFTVTALPGDIGGDNPVKLWHPGVIAL